MSEQVIISHDVQTLGDLRRAIANLSDDLPLRDHVMRPGLAASLIKTEQGEILDVA